MARKIHTNKPKIEKLAKDIGEIYKAAANDPNHVIDRQAVVQAIEAAIISNDRSTENPGSKDRKTLMFDVVVDEDLDANTRLVWITLPTPDLKFKGASGYESWKDYMKKNLKYNTTTNTFDNYDKLEELTEFILFGCGR